MKQFFTDDVLVSLANNDTLLGVDMYSIRTEIWRIVYPDNDETQLIDVVEVNKRIYVVTVAKDYAVSLLNVYSGTLEWTITVGGLIERDSLIGAENTLLITSRKGYCSVIHAVDSRSSRSIWEFVMSGHGEGLDPFIINNRVYVTGAERLGSVEYNGRLQYPTRIYCIDLLTGNVIWLSRDWYPYHNLPALTRSRLFVSDNAVEPESREGIVCVYEGAGVQHMLNRATGELLWMYDTNTLAISRP